MIALQRLPVSVDCKLFSLDERNTNKKRPANHRRGLQMVSAFYFRVFDAHFSVVLSSPLILQFADTCSDQVFFSNRITLRD